MYLLDERLIFPPAEDADRRGIVAIGGDLSKERLLLAYRSGIFPWYNEDDPILWWSPNPRFILFPDEFRVSKSLKKVLKKKIFTVTFDKAFKDVITMCKDLRSKSGTWITDEMLEAYVALHNEGYAHSVEAWYEDSLVGGLYGVSLGKAFFGESMFHIKENASKVALVYLVEFAKNNSFLFIDSQVYTEHLASLGAKNIARKKYLDLLKLALQGETIKGSWQKFS